MSGASTEWKEIKLKTEILEMCPALPPFADNYYQYMIEVLNVLTQNLPNITMSLLKSPQNYITVDNCVTLVPTIEN